MKVDRCSPSYECGGPEVGHRSIIITMLKLDVTEPGSAWKLEWKLENNPSEKLLHCVLEVKRNPHVSDQFKLLCYVSEDILSLL